jgi:hypothetical protein
VRHYISPRLLFQGGSPPSQEHAAVRDRYASLLHRLYWQNHTIEVKLNKLLDHHKIFMTSKDFDH